MLHFDVKGLAVEYYTNFILKNLTTTLTSNVFLNHHSALLWCEVSKYRAPKLYMTLQSEGVSCANSKNL